MFLQNLYYPPFFNIFVVSILGDLLFLSDDEIQILLRDGSFITFTALKGSLWCYQDQMDSRWLFNYSECFNPRPQAFSTMMRSLFFFLGVNKDASAETIINNTFSFLFLNGG